MSIESEQDRLKFDAAQKLPELPDNWRWNIKAAMGEIKISLQRKRWFGWQEMWKVYYFVDSYKTHIEKCNKQAAFIWTNQEEEGF